MKDPDTTEILSPTSSRSPLAGKRQSYHAKNNFRNSLFLDLSVAEHHLYYDFDQEQTAENALKLFDENVEYRIRNEAAESRTAKEENARAYRPVNSNKILTQLDQNQGIAAPSRNAIAASTSSQQQLPRLDIYHDSTHQTPTHYFTTWIPLAEVSEDLEHKDPFIPLYPQQDRIYKERRDLGKLELEIEEGNFDLEKDEIDSGPRNSHAVTEALTERSEESVGESLDEMGRVAEWIKASTLAQYQQNYVYEEVYEGEAEVRSESQARPKLKRINSGGTVVIYEAIDNKPMRSIFQSSINPDDVNPSLITIEKIISAKNYFECFYYNILNRQPIRNQRLNQLEQHLAAANLDSSRKKLIRSAHAEAETDHLRNLRSRVDINSFIKLKTIGSGSFGVSATLLRNQEAQVRAERDILKRAEGTRWATRLIYSFQDVDHLYLVLKYMSGGDFYSLLVNESFLRSEDCVKFYIAEMILAIEEPHNLLGAIHRDIKPKNFLINNEGHIRISDFGLATDHESMHASAILEQQRAALLAKHGVDVGHARAPLIDQVDHANGIGTIQLNENQNKTKRAFSIAGSQNYMSVEILRGSGGYTESCDWWSLGCILYECIFGYQPFPGDYFQDTTSRIRNWEKNLKFPDIPISKDCQDLIKALVCGPEDRIGSTGYKGSTVPIGVKKPAQIHRSKPIQAPVFNRYQPNRPAVKKSKPVTQIQPAKKVLVLTGAAPIKAHPWFKDINFAKIHLQTPPFVPILEDPSSTKYFDQFMESSAPDVTDLFESPRDSLFSAKKKSAFVGWTRKARKQEKEVYDPSILELDLDHFLEMMKLEADQEKRTEIILLF